MTEKNVTVLFALILLALMLEPSHAAVQALVRCNDACLKAWQVEGECLLPKSFTGGMTPYTFLPQAQLCPDGQSTCYCKTSPNDLCSKSCMSKNWTAGVCERDMSCIAPTGGTAPGYGYVAELARNPDVPCTTMGSNFVCCCRRASPEVEQGLASLNVAAVWPTLLECSYLGGENAYLIQVAGMFTGGRGIQVTVPGASVAGAVPIWPVAGEGFPPAAIHGTGWFFETRKIPRSAVERLAGREVAVRFTVIPWPGQALNRLYSQSLAPNYPVDYGRTIGNNYFETTVSCPPEELPTPEARERKEGPKELNIRTVTCTNAADKFQNPWHLTDFDANSSFMFAENSTTSSCTLAFDTTNVYGIQACAAANSTVNITKITIGNAVYRLSVPVAEWPACTNISLASLNATAPVRAGGIVVEFKYDGGAGLTTLDPFPEVVSVDSLAIAPSSAVTGADVDIRGTVTRKSFTAPDGRLVACEYQWEGGCYPCIGADCSPSQTAILGNPNWAFLIPMPWRVFETVENKTKELLGVQLLPASSTAAIDIVMPQGTTDQKTGKDNFCIRPTLRNALSIATLEAVNIAVNNLLGDAPEWIGPVATLLSTGISALAPITALISLIPGMGEQLEPCVPCKGAGWGCGLLGYAIYNELDSKRCTPLTTHAQTQKVLSTCNVPYIFVTWFDLKSVPEPDPDKKGPYELYEQTCPEVTFLEKWLFNAGWWSAWDFLADRYKEASLKGQAEDAARLAARTADLQDCSVCVKGIAKGTLAISKAQRDLSVQKCNASSAFPTCFNVTSYDFYSPTNSSCNANDIKIDSKDKCDTIPNGTTLAPAKWCAKPIKVGSDVYHAKVASVSWDGQREEGGKCVLRDSECPKEWGTEGAVDSAADNVWAAMSEADCARLKTSAEIGTAKKTETVKDLDCRACIAKRAQYCYDLAADSSGNPDLMNSKGMCRPTCPQGYKNPPSLGESFGPGKYAITLEAHCAIIDEVKKAAEDAAKTQIKRTVDAFSESIWQGQVDKGIIDCQRCIAAGRTWCILPENINTSNTGLKTRLCTKDETKCTGGAGTIVRPGGNCDATNTLERILRTVDPQKRELWISANRLMTRIDENINLMQAQKISGDTLNRLLQMKNKLGDLLAALQSNMDINMQDAQNTVNGLQSEFDSLRATLASALGYGNITVTVTDGTGGAVPNAQVTIAANGTARSILQTDNSGKCVFKDLAPGTYTASAGDAYYPQTVTLEAKGSKDVTLSPKRPTKPTPLSPIGDMASPPSKFEWTRVEGTSYYELNISCGADQWQRRTSSNSYSITANDIIPYGVQCTWKVRACTATACGDWSDTQTFKIKAPPAPTCTFTPPKGEVNKPYSAQMTCTGGTAPYTCAISEGSLPEGLILDVNGTIRGTPMKAETKTFKIKVTDAAKQTWESQQYTIEIAAAKAKFDLSMKFEPSDENCMRLVGTVKVLPDSAKIPCLTYQIIPPTQGASEYKTIAENLMPGSENVFRVTVRNGATLFDESGRYTIDVAAWNLPCTQNGTRMADIKMYVDVTPGTFYTRCLLGGKSALTSYATSSELAQLGEIPSAGSSELFGSLPATGKTADDEISGIWRSITDALSIPAASVAQSAPQSSAIPATGMQTAPAASVQTPIAPIVVGSGASSIVQMLMSQARINLQQVLASIQFVEAMKTGKSVYTRRYIVQPGLAPETRCPVNDPAMPRKSTLKNTVVSTIVRDKPVISDPWPYYTTEGIVEPVRAQLYLTIRNETGAVAPGCLDVTSTVDGVPCSSASPPSGCYVDCENVPIYSDAGYAIDGQLGRFSYLYSAPSSGTYRATVRAAGGIGNALTSTFRVQNRTPPAITGMLPAICSMPNEAVTIAPILMEPNISVGGYYTVSVDVGPVGDDTINRDGWVPNRVGLVSCDANGTCKRVASMNVSLQPGQALPLALESNVTATTSVRILVRDAGSIYGVRAQQNFTHKIVARAAPDFDVVAGTTGQASAAGAGQSFDFRLRLKNNIIEGCQPESWQVTKERPGPGWAVYLNATDEPISTPVYVPAGNSTEMTLHVLPTAFDAIRTFPVYALASEHEPTKLVDTAAGAAAQAMATDGTMLWYASADKKIRAADVITGSVLEHGAVPTDITGIAANPGSGGSIYWISGGKIWKSAKSAFTPIEVVTGLSQAARGLAVDGETLYWFDAGAIKRASASAVEDCSQNACTFISGVPNAFSIAIDATRIYWSADSDVWWASKGAVPGTSAENAASAGVAGVAWANKRAVALSAAAGAGMSGIFATLVPDPTKATGKVVLLLANGTADDALGVDRNVHDYVYAIGQDLPKAVSADAGWVYWADKSGDVWRLPRNTLSDYVVVYYQYDPGAPRLDVRPSAAVATPGTPVTYTLTLTNGATVPINYGFAPLPALPTGWTATSIAPANGTLGPGAAAISTVTVTSPSDATAGASLAVPVRASVPYSSLYSQATIVYNVSLHAQPTVSVINITSTTASPGKDAWWLINVTNNDPLAFVSPANITLSVVSLPSDWTARFCVGGVAEERIATCNKVDSPTLTIPPTNSSDVLLFVQSSKRASDGDHMITIKADVGGLSTFANMTYTVLGCGNDVCNPERGEYERAAVTWCERDCGQGYDDFRCYYANSADGSSWWQCSMPRDKSADFGAYVSSTIDAQGLSGVRVLACKRGASADACKAAVCGITRPSAELPDVIISDCIANMVKSASGVFGPLYVGSVACPADAEGEFYLLYTGTRVASIAGQAPVVEVLDWASSNFTFECPRYGVGDAYRLLNDPVRGYKKKLEDCQRAYQIYANAYGAGSVCAQMTLQACNIRRAHLENLTAVLAKPTELGANATQSILARTAAIEAQLDSLAAQCIGLPVLQIVNITPPGTRVGETARIRVAVRNMLNQSYRGYAACNVTLPDGSTRLDKSGCVEFSGNAETLADVLTPLTQPGNWSIGECAVWAESTALLPEPQCMNAAVKFPPSYLGASFVVAATDVFVNEPVANSLVSGTVTVNATISGNFDKVEWAAAFSDGCFGATWSALNSSGSAFTKDWTGTWDTTKMPDGEYWLCLRGLMGTSVTQLASVRVGTNNWGVTLNPEKGELAMRSRTTREYSLFLQNTGTADDSYLIKCVAPQGWTTTISSRDKSATCTAGINITLHSGESAEIVASTSVPNATKGTTVAINFTAQGTYENATASQKLTVSDAANTAPALANASTTPAPAVQGQFMTFKARIADAEGDDIVVAQACADNACAKVWCDLTQLIGSLDMYCNANMTMAPGTYSWWVRATDSLNLTSISAAGDYTVRLPPPQPCTFKCMPSCEPNIVYCVNRTDYGQRNCSEGFVCCKEWDVPNCVPPVSCSIVFEKAQCIWDPTALNYSVNVQAAWSGGIHAKISAAGITSGALTAKPATFSARVADSGTKTVAASVYSLAEETLCTNTTSVTCVRPDVTPAPSPVPGAYTISAVTARTSQSGNEAQRAIDNDQFTAWRSMPGMPQWIKLDLGMSRTVGGIGIFSSVGRPKNFVISTSPNDATYTAAATVQNANYVQDWNVTMFGARDARYVLINITSAEQNTTYIYEVKVYPGAGAAPQQPPAEGMPAILIALAVGFGALAVMLYVFRRRITLWWSYVRG